MFQTLLCTKQLLCPGDIAGAWRQSLTSCDNCVSPRNSTCSAAWSHADSSTVRTRGIIRVRKDLQGHQCRVLTEHHPVDKTITPIAISNDSTTSLGSLLQCLTTLSVKKQQQFRNSGGSKSTNFSNVRTNCSHSSSKLAAPMLFNSPTKLVFTADSLFPSQHSRSSPIISKASLL